MGNSKIVLASKVLTKIFLQHRKVQAQALIIKSCGRCKEQYLVDMVIFYIWLVTTETGRHEVPFTVLQGTSSTI